MPSKTMTDANDYERFCDCDELLIGEGKDRHRIPMPKYHCCAFVAERNRLIEQAQKIATEKVGEPILHGDRDERADYSIRWTREFSRAMDSLAKSLLNGASDSRAQR
jgi:hypothetical protein